MCNFKIIFPMFFVIAALVSCSHTQKKDSTKLEYIKYESDQVSVMTALNLAQAAYLRGCIEQLHEQKEKLVFNLCLEKAKKFVTDDVIFILDQDPKEKKNP